ncbi:unnamed protein product [Plutella xylostella]|uniref:(diamondback moth) hypothetical protein n=1 Tax=Plutella xylostella TaxID=51655 RepID=A0A8S4G9P1_PLUXY|nr:unnamed protein product [Plutella xylostella]
MDYLERCRFVHRDLAARNILLHTSLKALRIVVKEIQNA